MKLVHPDYEYQINLDEGASVTIEFDDPRLFRRFAMELLAQSKGEDGAFVLSEKGKEIPLENHLIVITDILAFDIDDKRVANKIQTMLKSFVISEDMFEETRGIISNLSGYAEKVVDGFQFPICYQEPDANSLVKLLSLHLVYDYQTEMERLIEFIKVLNEVCGINIFILLNMHSYFSEAEINAFLQDCHIAGYSMILLEAGNFIKSEPTGPFGKAIIDEDGFEIF